MICKYPSRKVVWEPEVRMIVSMPNHKKTAAGTSKAMLWGHAAKPPDPLSEGTGNSWKPHFQEADTQKNFVNFNNWHWMPMDPMFWDSVTLYVNDKVDLLSWARKIWRVLCPFPLVSRAALLLLHPPWYWMREHHLRGGCQVKISDETL